MAAAEGRPSATPLEEYDRAVANLLADAEAAERLDEPESGEDVEPSPLDELADVSPEAGGLDDERRLVEAAEPEFDYPIEINDKVLAYINYFTTRHRDKFQASLDRSGLYLWMIQRIFEEEGSSPFTGGAVLGDRVRMRDLSGDNGVFIRSMATRGSLGGLSKKVVEVFDILDSAGKDFIIIETVGVCQSELDVATTADTTLVVLVPESGDAIQAMKAGLMEIADIFVLNKSDRQGADGVAATIKNIIHLKPPSEVNWNINVLKTVGSLNKGIEELLDEILKHREHMTQTKHLDSRMKA